ncbi:MAG: hypothetical protein K2P21_09185 [Lachnospiraceae bacterium]|nr:hypothetical protein [Lachnospiraceae bacterium]
MDTWKLPDSFEGDFWKCKRFDDDRESLGRGRTAGHLSGMNVSGFDFNGANSMNLADTGSSYYAGGAYLTVLNNLKANSTGGTILMRFCTIREGLYSAPGILQQTTGKI